jgi:hypothetical protein
MNLSNYAETLVANFLFNGQTATRPTAWYVALHTGEPGETGASNEVSAGGYARTAVVFGAASSGAVSNSGDVEYTASADWGVITHVSIWDAETAGNCLAVGALQQTAKTFTALLATDVLTSPAHGYADGDRVVLYEGLGGAMPTGLTAGTAYHVRDSATDSFKVSATSGGAAIDLTGSGAGIVCKIVPKQVDNGDTVKFAAAALSVTLY